MRSYCVIPPSARDDPFFGAVYEDGVRAEHQGRILPLPFTHVLSPAHDFAKHINGPLLEAVQDGHNAMLLVALPAATALSARRASQHSRQTPTVQLFDCTEAAMELYANLLPLLFQNAPACTEASLSVVTASAQDRTVVDELAGGQRVRTLREVSWHRVARETSAAAWGPVMGVLANRHAALATPDLNGETGDEGVAAQTACVVTVQLSDGYGRVLLVDAGSDQELLHALTLILGVAGVGGQVRKHTSAPSPRTYPSRTPLLTLLKENVSDPATCAVHVVSVPHPGCEPRNSLRIMRFASDVAAVEPEGLGVDTPRMGAHRRDRKPTPDEEERTRLSATSSSAPPASNAKDGRGPAICTSPSDPVCQTSNSFLGPSPIPQRAQAQGPSSSSLLSAPAVGARGAEDPHHSSNFLSKQLPDSQDSSRHRPQQTTPSPLPPAPPAPPQTSVAVHTDPVDPSVREQPLLARIAVLESQLRDLTTQHSTVLAARRQVEKQMGALKASLREKQDAWLHAQEASAAAKKENEEFAALVPKLLKKITALEKRRDELVAAQATSDKTGKAREAVLKEKDNAIATLHKKLSALERKETQRVRQANLQRISEHSAASADTTSTTEKASRQDRVADIALQELRRRNRELERALATAEARTRQLQLQLQQDVTATTAKATVDSPSAPLSRCASCDQLEDRLAYFMRELTQTRKEKDELVEALIAQDTLRHQQQQQQASNGDTGAHDSRNALGSCGGFTRAIILSLLAGCASLRGQLESIQAAIAQGGPEGTGANALPSRPRGSLAGVSAAVVAEHLRAVDALTRSIREIGARQCTASTSTLPSASPHVSQGGSTDAIGVPPLATAADVAALTTLLTFEAERTVHLRAFLPTFAQLAVATEHMRMRLKKAAAAA